MFVHTRRTAGPEMNDKSINMIKSTLYHESFGYFMNGQKAMYAAQLLIHSCWESSVVCIARNPEFRTRKPQVVQPRQPKVHYVIVKRLTISSCEILRCNFHSLCESIRHQSRLHFRPGVRNFHSGDLSLYGYSALEFEAARFRSVREAIVCRTTSALFLLGITSGMYRRRTRVPNPQTSGSSATKKSCTLIVKVSFIAFLGFGKTDRPLIFITYTHGVQLAEMFLSQMQSYLRSIAIRRNRALNIRVHRNLTPDSLLSNNTTVETVHTRKFSVKIYGMPENLPVAKIRVGEDAGSGCATRVIRRLLKLNKMRRRSNPVSVQTETVSQLEWPNNSKVQKTTENFASCHTRIVRYIIGSLCDISLDLIGRVYQATVRSVLNGFETYPLRPDDVTCVLAPDTRYLRSVAGVGWRQ
ncbi:hypothetical protein CLF_112638 [Clonorchis sinensis]|uniref:Uncharacterized protein n=1 Tax=Clonorchis sinensis TaxID=79923 RepID=G7YWQ1_CLOSI|nr:hypothetical protein CLF_112638 [Clonorchis sinensis]